MSESFGSYLRALRVAREVTLRSLATSLNITAPYLSDIEKSRRNPPSFDVQRQIVAILGLNRDEADRLYDLAGASQSLGVAPDLSEYIASHATLRLALRKARDMNIDEAGWEKIIADMNKGE